MFKALTLNADSEVWLTIISHIVIALARYCIASALVYFVYKRGKRLLNSMFLLFAVFSFVAGTQHILEIWTPQIENYWLNDVIKVTTAFVSLLAAISVVLSLPKIIAIPDPLELEKINKKLESEITERQHVEARLNDILNNANASIVCFRVFSNRDWEYEYQSKGNEGIFGYTQAEILADKTLWMSRVLPEDVENVIMPLFEDIFAERPATVTYRFKHKDGSLRWIDATYTSRRDAEANCWVVTSVSIDITEQRESEERLREIAETINAVFYISDASMTQLLYISPAYERIWGRSRESLYKHPSSWMEAIHPEDNEKVASAFRELSSRKLYQVEYRILRADGSIGWIFDRAFPVYDLQGNVRHYVGLSEDVSERKQAEIALQEQEEFLRSIYDGVEFCIFIADVLDNGEFRYFGINSAGERLTGISSQEIYGKTPEDIFQENAFLVKQRYAECVRLGTTISYEECLPFQGQYSHWITNLTPLRDNNQRIYRIVGTAINITSRKQAEEKLSRSEALLASAQRIARLGSWEYDLNSQKILWSEETFRIYGIDPSKESLV